jgi:hypothetical protein
MESGARSHRRPAADQLADRSTRGYAVGSSLGYKAGRVATHSCCSMAAFLTASRRTGRAPACRPADG